MARSPKGRRKEDQSPKGDEEGLVVRVDSRLCRVRLEDETLDCRIRGILFRNEKKFGKPVAVGDRVLISRQRTPPHVVESVLPRRNLLARTRATARHHHLIATNLDQVVLVSACIDPSFNPRLIDRMLVACEHDELRAVIVINKIDLVADLEPFEEFAATYRSLGYPVYFTSIETRAGLDDLMREFDSGISCFAGMSGVGKSALLTAIQPELSLSSGSVSEATGKGKHTTTCVSLLPLESGGYVVDTPGIREFGMIDLEAADIGYGFPEFREHLRACRFRRCTHDHEVGCAVLVALDEGTIDPFRYDSYLRIIRSLDD